MDTETELAEQMAVALDKAISIMGGPKQTAKKCGISQQAISQWIICPVARVIELESLCKGEVTRYDLRPDIYPRQAPPRRRRS